MVYEPPSNTEQVAVSAATPTTDEPAGDSIPHADTGGRQTAASDPSQTLQLDNTPARSACTERRANGAISIPLSRPAEMFRVCAIKCFVFAASDMKWFIFLRAQNEQWRSARRPLSGIYAVDGGVLFDGVWKIELS